ncbi:hypothetical protein ACFQI7_08615 [Paenibacillus allorhizosphaerae]|uniref:DUF2269 family protein n=1 Tax=Paenibacillus allorhizosphaerae TaxID=2849866 RepID=A0ABM8VGS5_9BACL|nr:hypothetical protein [Paenibacillus allorhizosphaerae]CAG7639362.1 hypothetical protein PAECIP111802_02536 [Paenibacillus allorhizosphaerae]
MSKKLSQNQKSWWLITHLLFTAMWIGGGFTQIIMIVLIHLTSSGEFLYVAHSFMHIFDLALIIPGALGVVITGIVLSARTHWGLTKYYWIISKEAIALILIASGGVLNIWVQDAIQITLTERLNALNNTAYLHDRFMLGLFGAGQLILLVSVVWISVKKPWGKRKSKRFAEAAGQ